MFVIDANPNIDKADPIFKAIRDKNNEELKKILYKNSPIYFIGKTVQYTRVEKGHRSHAVMNIIGYALLRCNFEALRIIAEYDYSKEYKEKATNSSILLCFRNQYLGAYFSLFKSAFNNCSATGLVYELLNSENTVKNLDKIEETSIKMLKCLIEIGKYESYYFSAKFNLDLCTDLLESTDRIENVLEVVKSLPESENVRRFFANYYFNEANELKSNEVLAEHAIEKSLEHAIFLKNNKERDMFVKRYLYGLDVTVQGMQQELPKIVYRILDRGYKKESMLKALKLIKEAKEEPKNVKENKKELKKGNKFAFEFS